MSLRRPSGPNGRILTFMYVFAGTILVMWLALVVVSYNLDPDYGIAWRPSRARLSTASYATIADTDDRSLDDRDSFKSQDPETTFLHRDDDKPQDEEKIRTSTGLNGIEESVEVEGTGYIENPPQTVNNQSADSDSKKPNRPKLVPGEWSQGHPEEILEQLKKNHPHLPEAFLRDRAEFGALNLCSPFHIWYSCIGDSSCVLNTNCIHRVNETPVTFKDESFLSAFRYEEEAANRRRVLSKMIDRMDSTVGKGVLRKDGFLMMMTLNSGFSFLFGNWICSMMRHKVDLEQVKTKTLVLPRDEDARQYVEAMGFFVPTADELDVLTKWTAKQTISRKPASGFGQGEHKHLNMFFKFGMPLDLLEMNMTVILQDVDFVWFRNPVPLIREQCAKERCHAIFISEGRLFVRDRQSSLRPWRSGPRPIQEVNTGLYMLTNTPEIKHFLRILMQGLHLQQWRRRDQLYYNTVAWHSRFEKLLLKTLSSDLFVPGERLHQQNLQLWPLKPVSELAVIHVSDTGNYELKIKRLKAINHWYFTADICPNVVTQCRNISSCWSSLRSCQDC